MTQTIRHEPLALTEDNLTCIGRYALSDEREPPLVFHGREPIRERISRLIEKVQSVTTPDGPGSRTHVISGVPGAGKTSLLQKLKTENEEQAHFILLQGDALSSQERFVESVIDALDLPEGESVDIYQTQTRSVDKGFSKYLNYTRGKSNTNPPLIDRERSHWTILEDLLQKKYKRKTPKPVVLCVDEAQNITTQFNFTQQIIRELHALNTGRLHVIPILAGLTNILSQLDNAGLSRIGTSGIYTIGKLSDLETQLVVKDTLQHKQFGLKDKFVPNDLIRLAKLLSKVSEQWPRHLHYYITGFLSVLHDTQTAEPKSQAVDLQKVLDIGNQERVGYYAFLRKSTQSFEVVDFNKKVLGSLFQEKGEVTKDEMYEVGSDLDLFDDRTTFHEILYDCCRKGFVQEIHPDTEIYSVPIPSLRTYLTRQHDPTKETLALLEESQRIDQNEIFDQPQD